MYAAAFFISPVGVTLTALQTMAMFMRYVHTEDDSMRKATELMANQRKSVVAGKSGQKPTETAFPARSFPEPENKSPGSRPGWVSGLT